MGEIIVLLLCCIKIYLKKNIFIILDIIIFLIELIFILNIIKYDYYCKDWKNSLNNSFIYNNKNIGPFFNFSKIFNIKCEKRSYNEKLY